MPLHRNDDGTHTVFLEETSLVGKGLRRLTFEECQRRLYKRLAFHQMSVLGVREEEYCYIPMGGELPDLQQRCTLSTGCVHLCMCCILHLRGARLGWIT
jgi:lycopene beta-cyclase